TREKLLGAMTRFVLKQSTPSGGQAPRLSASESNLPKVLVVEDEPVIAARIEFALGTSYSATLVGDGEAAIHRLLEETYDCVLLDLTLAHLSGFDVLRHMIVRQPELLRLTVIMTAANDESLQFIDPKSVAGVLRKPFDFAALGRIVTNVVSH